MTKSALTERLREYASSLRNGLPDFAAAMLEAVAVIETSSPPPTTGSAPDAEAWMPTHRHRKGGLYRVIARATNCSGPELIDVVVYDEEGGKTTWVREAAQFDDGRFEPLPVDAASALDAAREGEEGK